MNRYSWAPQPGPQHALVTCPVFEIFYGGARGGGKTDGMLGKFAIKAKRYGEDCVGVFFRKTREDLKEAVERSKAIYGPLGATLTKNQWTFPNGARLKFEYLMNDKDADNYQGHNYTDVFFEELTHWPTKDPVMKLMATLRSAVGVPCQFHATGNPGGPGHLWVKHRYIDPAPKGWKILTETFTDPFNGKTQELERIFIPSKLTDNKLLYEGDPMYVAKLQLVGSEALVKAWLKGDWSIIEGAYFDCWSDNMVIRPFEIPKHWTRFRSMDWGSAAPFSIGWWAVASEDHVAGKVLMPKDSMIRYREWYGCKKDKNGASLPNKGLKLNSDEVCAGICEREGRKIGSKDPMGRSPCDPSMFASVNGPSIAEAMFTKGVTWVRGDNKRVAQGGNIGGWNQMRNRMKALEGGKPMLYTFSTCHDSIRTIPVLQHDVNKPEDLDTTQEDHAADEWRYACMSRPYTAPEIEPFKDNTWAAPTAAQLERRLLNGA